MPQNVESDLNRSAENVVREGISRFETPLRRYDSLPADSPEHETLGHILAHHEAWYPENKVEKILHRLSINGRCRRYDII